MCIAPRLWGLRGFINAHAEESAGSVRMQCALPGVVRERASSVRDTPCMPKITFAFSGSQDNSLISTNASALVEALVGGLGSWIVRMSWAQHCRDHQNLVISEDV